MKQLIKNVLDDMSKGQVNFESDTAREMITNTIMAAIKTEGGWFLDLSTIDGGPKLDVPIYENTEEQKARESWVCSICGENTFEVDFDYIGSGTNHLGCELKIEMNYRKSELEDPYRSEQMKLSEEIVDNKDDKYTYESDDGGKTVYKREFGSDKKELVWSSDEKGKFNKRTTK